MTLSQMICNVKIYFFYHILYVVDLIIVSISLGLELGLNNQVYQDVVAVIIFLRLWRLVRAGHGVITLTEEQHMDKLHKLIVRNTRLKCDVHGYRMEVIALERLLDEVKRMVARLLVCFALFVFKLNFC